jgi:hypothetical protein
MTAAMKRVAASRHLVTEMGQGARAFAERFTWDKSAQQTISHLESVVSAQGPRNG